MVTVQYTTFTNKSLCENVFVMTSMSVNCLILTYMKCFTSLLLSLRAFMMLQSNMYVCMYVCVCVGPIRHISSAHKTYRQICYSRVQLITTLNCVHSLDYIFLGVSFLQTKRRIVLLYLSIIVRHTINQTVNNKVILFNCVYENTVNC